MSFPILADVVGLIRRRPGVEYVDARAVDLDAEVLTLRGQGPTLRDPRVERLSHDRSQGIGVRVLYRGAWGFGARPGITGASASAAAADALIVAQAAARVRREPARLVEEEPGVGGWETEVEVDPFSCLLYTSPSPRDS